MNEDERQKDQELVAFTDALLKSQPSAECSRPPLADTVEMLARTLGPQPPPASLRRKLRSQIVAQWAPQRPPLDQRLLKLFGRPRQRWAWAAAAALVAVAVVAALLMPAGVARVAGTAIGEAGTVVLVILLVLAGILAVAWFFVGRKK